MDFNDRRALRQARVERARGVVQQARAAGISDDVIRTHLQNRDMAGLQRKAKGPPKRRSPEERDADRQKILEHVRKAGTSVRPPEGARAGDINHLVNSGQLTRTVKQEWDKSVGHQSNMFGGAAVMKRKRAYLSLPKEDDG